MKHIRHNILTLLALTLFGGAGAWAQGPTQVTQFTTDMIADWQGVNENVTLADLQALGFEAVDVSVAQAWTGAPQGDYSWLIYGFDAGNCNYIMFDDSGDPGSPSYTSYTKSYFYNRVSNGNKYFYTGAPNQAIELTKSGANQWSLGQTPDYDLELQVEYYEPHALKDIPAGWQVKVNGVDKTSAIVGDSLLITETDSVTLVPTDPRRVKSVTLSDEVSYITVAGLQLIGKDGDSWATIRDNNPDKIDLVSGYVYRHTDGARLYDGECESSGAWIDSGTSYNESYTNDYHWCQSN